jgi:hypothetical protein
VQNGPHHVRFGRLPTTAGRRGPNLLRALRHRRR